MRKITLLFLVFLGVSCTSNTIFEKPKNVIPKDTMILLMQDMSIASSARNLKNIHLERDVNYMHLIYGKYTIDSTRFKASNQYYITKVDDYKKMLEAIIKGLKKTKIAIEKERERLDSIRVDSLSQNFKEKNIEKNRTFQKEQEILKEVKNQ